jgi:hypothetical protein
MEFLHKFICYFIFMALLNKYIYGSHTYVEECQLNIS